MSRRTGAAANYADVMIWWWRAWARLLMPAAFQNFVQPINPGWVFAGVVNVTETNSSAPDTEREIVAKHSYGRQIGRVVDALVALIELPPTDDRRIEAFQELKTLSDEIEGIKTNSAIRHIGGLAADLKMLKGKLAPHEFEEMAGRIRQLLDEKNRIRPINGTQNNR
jgi:hypothetical protein